LLALTGRFEESIAEGRLAAQLDPLSPQVLIDAMTAPMFQKNFPAAKALTRKAAELDPTFFFPVMVEGWIDLNAGKFREAIPPLRKASTMGRAALRDSLSRVCLWCRRLSGQRDGGT
jgi:hypothetical protein